MCFWTRVEEGGCVLCCFSYKKKFPCCFECVLGFCGFFFLSFGVVFMWLCLCFLYVKVSYLLCVGFFLEEEERGVG